MKIAVLGAGHGGQACAADLALAGHQVNLYASPGHDSRLQSIIKRGGIELLGPQKEGFAQLHRITTNMEEAIEEVGLIFVVVPAFALEDLARASIPYLVDRQNILIMGSGSGGALVFAKLVREISKRKNVVLGDTNSLPYSTRITGPGQVTVFRRVKHIMFAAFPSKNTTRLQKVIEQLYPDMVPVSNVLETMLNNGNAVSHVAPVILNAGRIEHSKGEFYIYQEGVTPSVGNVLDAVDKERVAILRALGLHETSFLERVEKSGLAPGALSIREAINSYPKIKGPANLVSDRYIVEDVPYGLVPMASLGKTLKVETPVMNSLVTLASALTQRNFWKEGVTLEKMGISGLTLTGLAKYLSEGNTE